MNNSAPLACHQHDHNQCIDTALATARARCTANGAKLTAQREQVLKLIWQSHKPLGAYALIDMMAAESTKPVAPPTVYRALDFLLEQRLIHRIHSLNAFIGCCHTSEENHEHPNNFLICRDCGVAVEFDSAPFQQAVTDTAQGAGFVVSSQAVELVGQCINCQEASHG